MSRLALAHPGAPNGGHARRRGADHDSALQDLLRGLRSRLRSGAAPALPPALVQALRTPAAGDDDDAALQRVRLALRREGMGGAAAGVALALAARAMLRTLGVQPYPTQLHAAWLMLQGFLVEMATGEGKTLATALAAAVAALGGVPVHVLTANDYLVQRDRDALASFYTSLGLSVACVLAGMDQAQRRTAWRAGVVYATAREVTFDHLRDHLAHGGERDARVLRARALAALDDPAVVSAGADTDTDTATTLPGLHLCLIDEADSILLDEAVVPLVLAAPAAALDVPAYQRAYALACTLQRGRDYSLRPGNRAAMLTAAGRTQIAAAVRGAGGALAPARRAFELVEAALAARLLYRRDRDYVLRDGRLQLIDEPTGRIADGRQWHGALQPMVEIKERLVPGTPTRTAAQITYQRFFPRYRQIGGMSGTLFEARHELRLLYDAPVVRLPLARADRRRWLGVQVWVDAGHKWRAVLQAVRSQHAEGRPVLVGTDSVADALHLSALLQAAGLTHQVLTASQSADEAACVAQAGRAGTITVATNIAGRGTDIRLDAAALACGGLHVIATMHNRARRIDRQLVGRAARHGDPGSAQAILALDDALPLRAWPGWLLRFFAARADAAGRVPGGLAVWLFALAQRRSEWRDQAHRRVLRQADRRAGALYAFLGGIE